MKKGLTQFILFCFILLFFGVIAVWFLQKPKEISTYDAARAYNDVLFQTSLGPRLPGSQAHLDTIEYVVSELTKAGWQVELQQNERLGHPLTNIIARSGMGKQWVILGAHYDSRISADQDPDLNMRHLPVTGANDGASGVAVLLELARSLPQDLDREVWLVFFDLEDQPGNPCADSAAHNEALPGAFAFSEAVVAGKHLGTVVVGRNGRPGHQADHENKQFGVHASSVVMSVRNHRENFRFRSPYTSSIRLTLGQNLFSATQGSGKTASSRL